MAESKTVKIMFRGEEVEIPASEKAWFEEKNKAEKSAETKETKSKK